MTWKSLVVDSIGLFCITRKEARTGIRGQRNIVALLGFLLLALWVMPTFAADFTEPSNIFRKRCSACHTFGKGVKVGPDLKGVTERRQRDWLLKFVRSSQTVIQSGDPTAKTLFDQFKPQKMPDWSDLSDKQISAIMDYFAANGPEIKPADERLAQQCPPHCCSAHLYPNTPVHRRSPDSCSRRMSPHQAGQKRLARREPRVPGSPLYPCEHRSRRAGELE